MRAQLEQLLQESIATVAEKPELSALSEFDPELERTRDPAHGDFATSIALRAAKKLGSPPREIAEQIVSALSQMAFGNMPPEANFKEGRKIMIIAYTIVACVFGLGILLAPVLIKIGR